MRQQPEKLSEPRVEPELRTRVEFGQFLEELITSLATDPFYDGYRDQELATKIAAGLAAAGIKVDNISARVTRKRAISRER